jgi:pSer/pThr/pTyr-binding forkhead associated (FHA) protein
MAAQYHLMMRTGPTPGSAFILEDGQTTIGRDPTNTIVINDAEVSRHHVRLILHDNDCILEDLGSTNGTAINGVRIVGPHVLTPGEVISFGEGIVLVFEAITLDLYQTVATAKPPVSAQPQPIAPSLPPRQASSRSVQPEPQPSTPDGSDKYKSLVLTIVAALILFAICACVSLLWYIDANFLWCKVLPFLAGCG